MPIPKIVHQSWKTGQIPLKWRSAVESVKHYHPGWDYRLWTDEAMDAHVREHHPEFHPVYAGMARNIMRADAFRYVLMHDLGGMYCDLDYKFLRPYDYSGCRVLLAAERSIAFGDSRDSVANFIFASEPRHPLWRDAIDDLTRNPPTIGSYIDVPKATGPGFLNRVYLAGADRYEGIRLEPRIAFNPQRTHHRHEDTLLRNNGMTYGLHLIGGSWKERWTSTCFRRKLKSKSADVAYLLGLRHRRR